MTKYEKKRVIQDFDGLDKGLKDLIKTKYPKGFENHLISYIDLNGEKVTVFPFETDDTFYMLKVSGGDAIKGKRGLRHHRRRDGSKNQNYRVDFNEF